MDSGLVKAVKIRSVAAFLREEPVPSRCSLSTSVISENIADLAGLVVAHHAYVLSLKGKPDTLIDGLTGEQRFLHASAQRWRPRNRRNLPPDLDVVTGRL
jgi:putative endopeptidase